MSLSWGGKFSTLNQYAPIIAQSAQQYGVDPNLLAGVIMHESGGNNAAVGTSGEKGIMQIMPATAAAWGVNPTDPAQSIPGAARFLAQQTASHGVNGALLAYNSGSASNTWDQQYADSVLNMANQAATAQTGAGAGSSGYSSGLSGSIYQGLLGLPFIGPALSGLGAIQGGVAAASQPGATLGSAATGVLSGANAGATASASGMGSVLSWAASKLGFGGSIADLVLVVVGVGAILLAVREGIQGE